MRRVAFHTLGCKVNQYDTQAMLESFQAAGWQVCEFDERADAYVVNTCTVTGTGDKKSVQIIRRVHRENPEAAIVVAGCLAQRDRTGWPCRACGWCWARLSAPRWSNCLKRRLTRMYASSR